MADVVAPAALGPAGPLKIRSELLARRMQGSVVVHDHRTTALRAEAVLDHRALGARPPELRVMTRAPLLQLTNLVDAESLLASGGDAAMKSQAVAQQLDEKVPVLEAALDGDGEAHSTQSVESDELTLSLDYCVVQLSRAPWWNDLLLRMPGWYIPGLRAGAFVPSSRLEGQPVGVPIAMVVTRNVQVTGRWSQADRTAAESHTSFGPWHIGETSLSFDQSEVQATLRIDGMQVIAVICSLLPAIPPADDPALAQPASPAAS
jgi:hypothetical protein